MWLFLALISAFFLGLYDVSKKKALLTGSVVSVLFYSTLVSSILFIPFILGSRYGLIADTSLFYTQSYGIHQHLYIIVKSVIVLSSWVCGYYGMKHLPITIVGPINATRPVMVLIGALTFLGEHLNLWQWVGVLIAIFSFYYMSRSSRREGIDFRHNRWIMLVVLSNVFGAVSGLYDRYLMSPTGVGLDKMAVQSWFNIYQCIMLLIFILIVKRGEGLAVSSRVLKWVVFISIFLSSADFVYFYALTQPDALISVISMVRRASVIVSFIVGAFLFKEHNLRSKAVDLLLVLLSMLALYIGSASA
ncbi:MAG: EamA family transporter [Bacteroidaceae bacterium]|nr:EamA family transporter [Bacteroidaceae bacterium]MBQ9176524.1 EamA family transporter [Bacteroidaceae bacterium]MBR1377721.1 EamA family transporter [Bacteroidaceae bacterium]